MVQVTQNSPAAILDTHGPKSPELTLPAGLGRDARMLADSWRPGRVDLGEDVRNLGPHLEGLLARCTVPADADPHSVRIASNALDKIRLAVRALPEIVLGLNSSDPARVSEAVALFDQHAVVFKVAGEQVAAQNRGAGALIRSTVERVIDAGRRLGLLAREAA